LTVESVPGEPNALDVRRTAGAATEPARPTGAPSAMSSELFIYPVYSPAKGAAIPGHFSIGTRRSASPGDFNQDQFRDTAVEPDEHASGVDVCHAFGDFSSQTRMRKA